MAYDEMELDLLGDRRTALFVIISDTDDTFNFVVSIMYTQLFNLLCDRADDQCGGQLKLSFCCADRSCKFALWKESRYLSNMRKTLDKKMAVDLLKKGRTHVKDFYSAKKDKTFAADLVMRVEEGRAQYSLEFPKTPMQTKT